MACNPTRIELSNAATTTVQITLATDPGDGTTVTLEVDELGIDASATTTSAVASFSITAVSAANNSIWDATIQVGANRPATAEVLVTETNTAQTVGVTIDDSSVTYCAPSAGGGGATVLNDLTDVTISLPIAKQVLYYNGADWRNVSLSASDIPNLDASKTTSGTFDAARIPVLSSLYADAAAAVPAGGTTGQVLAKASATDYDLTWSTATTGTVTSVGLSVPGGFTVAGTNPITGSGTFEITSSLSGIIKGDGAATFSGEGVINDLADVNIAMGAGNQDDILYYDHAAGAGSKIKGIARSSIGLSEFNDDLDYAASSHTHSASDITTGTLSDARLDLRVDAGATFDGQGSAVASAESVLVPIERSGVITAASLIANASGSITITVKRYTPSAGTLGSATTLGTIALASAQHNRDTTLSGWTTSVSAGDVLEFLTGGTIATVTRVTVKVKVEES